MRRWSYFIIPNILFPGFPEHMLFSEFRRRFEILHVPQEGKSNAVLDDKHAVELLLRGLEIDKSTYRLGLSQVGRHPFYSTRKTDPPPPIHIPHISLLIIPDMLGWVR